MQSSAAYLTTRSAAPCIIEQNGMMINSMSLFYTQCKNSSDMLNINKYYILQYSEPGGWLPNFPRKKKLPILPRTKQYVPPERLVTSHLTTSFSYFFKCFVECASRYNRVKINQLDAQLILSIFRQPLYVSGVSRSIIRGTTVCIKQLALIILFR